MKNFHHETIYATELSHWWYKVRRKMIHDFIKHLYPKSSRHGTGEGIKILDIGCGTGALLTELQGYGQVHGNDISPLALEFCRSRGLSGVGPGNATDIQAEDNSYDLVLALDVIEHIEDDKKALSEIHRVLKPGGFVIIFVPVFMFLWGVTDVLSQHYRRYTLRELRQKIKGSGLVLVKSSYFNSLLFPLIAGFRIFVRLTGIKIESEHTLGNKYSNYVFYLIFLAESFLLKYIKFPFGVSAYVIGQKALPKVRDN